MISYYTIPPQYVRIHISSGCVGLSGWGFDQCIISTRTCLAFSTHCTHTRAQTFDSVTQSQPLTSVGGHYINKQVNRTQTPLHWRYEWQHHRPSETQTCERPTKYTRTHSHMLGLFAMLLDGSSLMFNCIINDSPTALCTTEVKIPFQH